MTSSYPKETSMRILPMGAREKLNSIFVTAGSIAAAAIGLMFQSWAAFTVALVIGLALMTHDGAIRMKRRGRRGRS